MAKNEAKQFLGSLVAVLAAGGVALAGGQNSSIVWGLPLFMISIALAFLIQWLAFIPAFIFKTEKFYDLTGSITYISITLFSVLASPAADARSYLLMALVLIWAVRLGTFLFLRVLKSGRDDRFDAIKVSFPRFFTTWTLQGLWVSLTLSAALAAITTTVRKDLGVFALVGGLIWILGFGIEVLADAQKNRFRSDPANQGKFIHTGLWAWSRHPNYFGEIVLWLGVVVIALPVLRGWGWVTLISPVFVTLLITQISGVPMLEKKADDRWGGQPDYEAYKANTPVLIPWPPHKKDASQSK